MDDQMWMQPMWQCGECSTLFLKFATVELKGEIHKICPNPKCHGPINLCDNIVEPAVGWAFNHILEHSGIDETRRMNLRCIAEAQMGPWNDMYRKL